MSYMFNLPRGALTDIEALLGKPITAETRIALLEQLAPMQAVDTAKRSFQVYTQ